MNFSIFIYLFIPSASPIMPVPVGMMTPSPAVCTETAEMFVLVYWERTFSQNICFEY